MARALKFRAWDGNKMVYPGNTEHKWKEKITDTPYPKLMYLPMSYLLGDSNDAYWMQYTGLKDKHGKEIYEGDIVKDTTPFVDSFSEGTIRETMLFRVVWLHTAAKYGLITLDEEWIESNQMGERRLEIIGNIFDNPGLLEGV